MTMKKALITGITGQDGSYLAEFLLDKGYEVHGLVRRTSTSNTERIDHLLAENKITLHLGDMADAASIIRIVSQVRPDEIYNLAAQSHVQVSFETPEYTANSDALGTLRLLEAIRILTEISGERPLGWYTGRTGPNTRRLVMEEGGFVYDSDTYDDDLPYWEPNNPTGKPHLVIPYTLDTNDMRFTQVQGFSIEAPEFHDSRMICAFPTRFSAGTKPTPFSCDGRRLSSELSRLSPMKK